MICLGRYLRGKWVNHLALYSFVWTLSLACYQLKLIGYNYISGEAWIFIFAAWIALYLGTACAGLFSSPSVSGQSHYLETHLRTAIVLLSFAGLVSSAVLARNIMHSLDTQLLLALADQGNSIYTMRFQGELSGLMYLGFLPYAASALAGAYVGKTGSINFVAFLPLIAMTIDGVLSMQRGGILIAIILFIAGIYLTPKKKTLCIGKWQIGIALTLLVAGFFYVTMTRGMPTEYENQGPILNQLSDVAPSLPSLYMYLSAPPVGLSAYLQHPDADGSSFWGRYTFAPANRLLAKLGFDTYVPYYSEFYSTPVPVNTCTYLREVHADFGPLGIIGVPFLLGVLITIVESKCSNLAAQMVLAHLYVVILFSFTLLIVVTGYWYISLVASAGVAFIISKPKRPTDSLDLCNP